MEQTQSPNYWLNNAHLQEQLRVGDSVYLSEGDGDASIQLNVICQLCELVLLLLKCLQQTVDLLLCQHNSAVILQQERRNMHQAYHWYCMCMSLILEHYLEEAFKNICLFIELCVYHVSYLLKCFLAVQAGGGHLRQQDGHVLLLLPQPDEPLPDVSVHHTQRHLLLPTQSLVEIGEVSPDAGACALCCAGDLAKTWRGC